MMKTERWSMGNQQKDRSITIMINNQPHEAPKPTMTGNEIKQLGGGPMDNWLILTVKGPDPTAGGDDKQIQDEEVLDLKSGMHFRIVNPATFG
jgi:Multiubiquitin